MAQTLEKVKSAVKASKEVGKQAAIGGAASYLGGAQRAQEQGKGPGKEVLSGLKAGMKGAQNRGSWAAKHAFQAAGVNKKAPNKDLRRQSLKQQALQLAKKQLMQKARMAAIEAAPETFGLSIVAYYAVKNWKVTIAVIASIFLLLFAIFDQQIFDKPPDQAATVPTSSDICTPQQASFGQTSVCTIKVSFNGSADDMIITSTILPGTAFVSAGQKGTYNKAANSVSWDAKQLKLPLNPIDITVTLTVRVTTKQNNVKVWNAYVITPVNLSNSISGGNASNLPPNSNTCSGMYAHYMSIEPSHKNYGDPNCQLVKKDSNGTPIFDKDAILKQLQQIKASEATAWFICVVPNESGYNANAYLRASTSGNGAYGLVQMNPTGKGNGQYDNGEVNWQNQLSNGINYNDKVIHHNFSYWPTSYDSCIRSNGVSVP
jgi:hypothetical protein